jgi:probable addiction module antidote protein
MTTNRRKTTRYDSSTYLKNKSDVAAYLDAALEDGGPALIRHALGAAARACGTTKIAGRSGIPHDKLLHMLTKSKNLKFITALKIIRALGLRLSAELNTL